ncbi:hypothetical protein BKA63DRAFT_81223 [Paraphoma chrysanthemicola]|nr:hypothetical protein BKA63DRAFT_81223 [Paraphoma chrysanthemicola]
MHVAKSEREWRAGTPRAIRPMSVGAANAWRAVWTLQSGRPVWVSAGNGRGVSASTQGTSGGAGDGVSQCSRGGVMTMASQQTTDSNSGRGGASPRRGYYAVTDLRRHQLPCFGGVCGVPADRRENAMMGAAIAIGKSQSAPMQGHEPVASRQMRAPALVPKQLAHEPLSAPDRLPAPRPQQHQQQQQTSPWTQLEPIASTCPSPSLSPQRAPSQILPSPADHRRSAASLSERRQLHPAHPPAAAACSSSASTHNSPPARKQVAL